MSHSTTLDIVEPRQASQELRIRALQQAALAKLGQRALAGMALGLLMDQTVTVVAQTLDVEYAKILELLPAGDALRLRAGCGWMPGLVGEAVVGAGLDSQAGYTLQSSEPVVVADLRTETRFSGPPLLHDHRVVSGLSVIIAGTGGPFGVLGAHTTRRRKFTVGDVHFLQTAANVLAAAIGRNRAEEEIRGLNAELEQRVIQRTAQLQAANRELEAFSYTVSHDLRAPLRAIHGFSKILLEEYASKLEPDLQHYLEVIQQNATQMGALIDDLLTFSRLGRQEVLPRVVDPAAIAREAIGTLQGEFEGRHIELLIGELPLCQADPSLLRQVWVNLLSNALKYTRRRECARIELGARAAAGGCAYYVRDNGIGFDMRYAGKLFGVFERLHPAEEYEGTGVGLATVERIVVRHGGRVWAEAAPEQGATFWFTLGTGPPEARAPAAG